MAKINVTKNYRLFGRSQDNRPVDPRRHRKLEESMKRYGFLPCYPIVCIRDRDKHLVVKDGQHRLILAEKLSLPVYWIEDEVDFDVALVNCAQRAWALRDFAHRYATAGIHVYREGLEFSERHKIPIGMTFALLGGTTTFTNVQESFFSGTFKAKDTAWAEQVASIYGPMVAKSALLKNARFLEACMAICRVKDFDGGRLIHNAERCREKLASYSTRDAYLDMIEVVYNYGRKQLVAIKIAALTAMRERNAITQAKARKNQGAAKENGKQ